MRTLLFCLFFVVLILAFKNITASVAPSGPDADSEKHAVEQRIASLDVTFAPSSILLAGGGLLLLGGILRRRLRT